MAFFFRQTNRFIDIGYTDSIPKIFFGYIDVPSYPVFGPKWVSRLSGFTLIKKQKTPQQLIYLHPAQT